MEDRRRYLRRENDRALLTRLRELEANYDRREHAQSIDHARRRAIRHNCVVSVGFDISGSESVEGLGTLNGRVLDLSVGGASIFTHERLELGRRIALAIRLYDASHIDLRAVVRWVKAIPDKEGFVSGVQFMDVSGVEQSKILVFLRELDATVGL